MLACGGPRPRWPPPPDLRCGVRQLARAMLAWRSPRTVERRHANRVQHLHGLVSGDAKLAIVVEAPCVNFLLCDCKRAEMALWSRKSWGCDVERCATAQRHRHACRRTTPMAFTPSGRPGTSAGVSMRRRCTARSWSATSLGLKSQSALLKRPRRPTTATPAVSTRPEAVCITRWSAPERKETRRSAAVAGWYTHAGVFCHFTSAEKAVGAQEGGRGSVRVTGGSGVASQRCSRTHPACRWCRRRCPRPRGSRQRGGRRCVRLQQRPPPRACPPAGPPPGRASTPSGSECPGSPRPPAAGRVGERQGGVEEEGLSQCPHRATQATVHTVRPSA